MRKKLLHNLGLKLASLVLAFVLWFLVVQIEDPQDTTSFSNIPVKLINTELLEAEGKVYEVLDNTDKVRVTVYAPRSIIDKIRSTDIVAEADVKKLTDINTIAINFYVENMKVDAIVSNQDVVRLNVEEKKSKWIRLVSNTVGEVAEGYIVSNTSLDQTNIEITGPESAVSAVAYAGVDISVAGATASLSANVDIQLYDEDGNVVAQDSIKKNVNSAYMNVEVLATKSVPVRVEYTGVPAEGYMATGVTANISAVEIAGTTAALANISEIVIPEEAMNIADKNSDMVNIVNLKEYLPGNIKLANKEFDGRVTVTVSIEPVIERELHVPADNISVKNLPEGLKVEALQGTENYSLNVCGLGMYVTPLLETQVMGTVDFAAWMAEEGLEELTPGIYKLPVVFHLDENISIEEPVLIEWKVSKEIEE